MVFAAELARLTGALSDDDVVDRHRSILDSPRPADHLPGRPLEHRCCATMKRDKKARGDLLRFIVLDDIARPTMLPAPTRPSSSPRTRRSAGEAAPQSGWHDDDALVAATAPTSVGSARREPDVYGASGPRDVCGSREPDVDGAQDLSALRALLAEEAGEQLEIELRQTDDEAELIGWLHEAVDTAVAGHPESGRVHALHLRAAGCRGAGDRRLGSAPGRGAHHRTRTRGRSSATRASSPGSQPG